MILLVFRNSLNFSQREDQIKFQQDDWAYFKSVRIVKETWLEEKPCCFRASVKQNGIMPLIKSIKEKRYGYMAD